MFKLLEKSPFVRWKFVQRMVHKRRMSKSTGTNRYKTFSGRTVSSNDTEQFIDSESLNESAAITQNTSSKSKSPFYTRKRLDKANAEIALLDQVELEASPQAPRRAAEISIVKADVVCTEEIDTTEATGDEVAELTKVPVESEVTSECAQTEVNNGADESEIVSAVSTAEVKEIEEVKIDNHLISKQKVEKPQYNPLSFQRGSKLRNSLKEFKRRSSTHLDNARQSMRRRTDARKYDNLDDETKANNNEDIVNYEHSPGAKRRQQVIEI